MRNSLFMVGVFAVALGVAPACATKKFVRTSVGEVNDKVGTMGKSLEETQERVRTVEGKIVEVDSKAVAANDAAAKANAAAADAANKAARSRQDRRSPRRRHRSRNPQADLRPPCSAKTRASSSSARPNCRKTPPLALDNMVNSLKADKKAVWVEIEGHTDNVGDAKYNESLGLMRAEAVKRYLYEKHQVPLHKINVISYGEEKPVAPNNTRDGRAQNRRVVIKVLA